MKPPWKPEEGRRPTIELDAEMFKGPHSLADLQKFLRTLPINDVECRRSRLFLELRSLTKRFMNERLAFEDVLTEEGIKQFSGSVYALEWAELYYAAEKRRQELAKLGYWTRLWHALLNYPH